jgi:phosphoglycolate/pyridoxal phosphate phosphatase family enzyme
MLRAARALKRHQSCLPNAIAYFRELGETKISATSQDIAFVANPWFLEAREREEIFKKYVFQSAKQTHVGKCESPSDYLEAGVFLNPETPSLTFWTLKDADSAVLCAPASHAIGKDAMSHVYVGICTPAGTGGAEDTGAPKALGASRSDGPPKKRRRNDTGRSTGTASHDSGAATASLPNVLSNDIDAVIFDCDGVIYRGPSMIPNADKVVRMLYAMKKRVFFLSNNASKTLQTYQDKFESMGIEIQDKGQIMSSALATAAYMKEHFPGGGACYCVGSPGLVETLREYSGMKVLDAKEDAHKGLKEMRTCDVDSLDQSVNCVVASLDGDLSYLKIHKAAMYIRYRNAKFLCTNKDATAPYLASGSLAPAAGACVAAVEVASGTKPVNIGKPSKDLMDIILSSNGLDPSRTLMVGDRLDTDIQFGKNGGLKTLLVLSGVTSREDFAKLQSTAGAEELPDFVGDSIACLLDEDRNRKRKSSLLNFVQSQTS